MDSYLCESWQFLKIRDIRTKPKTSEAFQTHINWPLPLPSPLEVIDLVSLSRPAVPIPFQMRSVDLNAPGTIGYSVAFDVKSFVSIVAHKRNEAPNASLYKYAHSGYLWMYMPINEGEYVTDVCRRVGNQLMERQYIGLIVRTLLLC